ncbi:MAG: efflux RND transporter periplasmic adaptor subunit [Candidatus Thiodiazotropha sp. (ex Lucina aurantia)]|uniref:Multidrug resistance protein MdtE n=1 Tax=Candidatus Thiodiazotropha endolucinida TaxID=1655433 RepID=A0A7Z1AFW8_9GAMM|nr:efflux RND transporter periplasmic adaptor subunit [Candidatus Thiodiazotropha endolucinida]MBT3012079.1 efflux RND transporter periplasmic adaptor subunit [Candidatus Thiodiazotropha sp. (ex Lucina pensylvanica)]MBT3022477.1 efflux RND transporter periplasmic adaptor subunit [Candidatus Thiodiazotropha taylori]MBT3054858.1 efflux RND transporter periplasmic adaptor subunit [Candidatus Thiodiazotropha sp. (ex Codakia orbicularis)]MBV2101926.1 efflux RND transporter periplasmic adaptor subuni
MRTIPHCLSAPGITLLSLLLAGCSQSSTESAHGKQAKVEDKTHLVAVEVVELRTLGPVHERNGTLKPRQTVRIFNQEEGRITKLPFFEGDSVAEGETIVTLDEELLNSELEKAVATAKQMRLNLKRQEELSKRLAVSQDELAQAQTDLSVAEAEKRVLQTRLGYTRISAPFTGVVSERLVEPGDVVPRHTHLMTIINPESLITRILVSDLLLPQLNSNDPVTVRIDGLGEKPFSGRIHRIYPELDETTRMGTIEVVLEPIPNGARSGQLCRVMLQTATRDRITVPFNALQRDTDGEFVYRLDERQQAMRAPIKSGMRIADRIEIVEGLESGDRIVTKGFLELEPGMKVEPVN